MRRKIIYNLIMQNKLKSKILISVLAGIMFLTTPAWAYDFCELGKTEFATKHYKKAGICFKEVLKTNPNDLKSSILLCSNSHLQ